MKIPIDIEKLTKEDLNESVIYLKFKNNKTIVCYLKIFDEEQNVYLVNNHFLIIAEFDDDGILTKFDRCFLVEQKNQVKNKFKKNIDSIISFRYSDFATNDYRKELRKKIKHEKDLKIGMKEMHRIFSKKFYVRIFNRNANLVCYLKVMDAYFIGSSNYFKIGKRTFDDRFFIVDKKWVLKKMIHDEKFRTHMLFTQEMLRDILDSNKLNKAACNILFRTILVHNESLYGIINNYIKIVNGDKK